MKKFGNVILLAFIWAVYYTGVGVANQQVSFITTGIVVRVVVFIGFTLLMLWQKRMMDIFELELR